MIKIAESGNTMIRIATTGKESGTQWTVYPNYVNDPTLQGFSPEQQQKVKELSITGVQDREDTSGRGMSAVTAEAIARLRDNLVAEQNKDLGMVADRIDIEPEGDIAHILDGQYGIKALEQQTPSTEVKG